MTQACPEDIPASLPASPPASVQHLRTPTLPRGTEVGGRFSRPAKKTHGSTRLTPSSSYRAPDLCMGCVIRFLAETNYTYLPRVLTSIHYPRVLTSTTLVCIVTISSPPPHHHHHQHQHRPSSVFRLKSPRSALPVLDVWGTDASNGGEGAAALLAHGFCPKLGQRAVVCGYGVLAFRQPCTLSPH
jgi:hypothetical protein